MCKHLAQSPGCNTQYMRAIGVAIVIHPSCCFKFKGTFLKIYFIFAVFLPPFYSLSFLFSAGIGRTGCFIATSIGCRQLKEEGVVDPLSIVCQLRVDR